MTICAKCGFVYFSEIDILYINGVPHCKNCVEKLHSEIHEFLKIKEMDKK